MTVSVFTQFFIKELLTTRHCPIEKLYSFHKIQRNWLFFLNNIFFQIFWNFSVLIKYLSLFPFFLIVVLKSQNSLKTIYFIFCRQLCATNFLLAIEENFQNINYIVCFPLFYYISTIYSFYIRYVWTYWKYWQCSKINQNTWSDFIIFR